MSFLKRWFGTNSQPSLGTPSQLDGHADSRSTDLGNQAATRRELIRVLARDTLRYAGIPGDWVECHVLMLPSRTGETFMHARLVVKHWDERLLRYAFAFQRRLMGEIERFEPGAAQWLLSITWQYMVDMDCPYRELPEPASWTTAQPQEVAPPAKSAAARHEDGHDDVQQDLQKLFAVRDAELAALADPLTGNDFAPTERGGL